MIKICDRCVSEVAIIGGLCGPCDEAVMNEWYQQQKDIEKEYLDSIRPE